MILYCNYNYIILCNNVMICKKVPAMKFHIGKVKVKWVCTLLFYLFKIINCKLLKYLYRDFQISLYCRHTNYSCRAGPSPAVSRWAALHYHRKWLTCYEIMPCRLPSVNQLSRTSAPMSQCYFIIISIVITHVGTPVISY